MSLHLALSGIQVLWLPHLSFNLLYGITIVEIAFLYRHRDWQEMNSLTHVVYSVLVYILLYLNVMFGTEFLDLSY